MNSKAISPLVATVVLVAFVVSLSVIISSFITTVAKDQTQTVSANSVCASKGALIIDSAMCSRVRDISLVGYWTLNSVNSTNYTSDSSGYGSDGVFFTNGSSMNVVSGQLGSGFQFDGVDDYVNVSYSQYLDIDDSSSLSIELWASPADGDVTNEVLIRKGASYHIWFPSSSSVRFADTVGHGLTVAASIEKGKWMHIAGVRDNATKIVYVYVNGNLAGNNTPDGGGVWTADLNNNAVFISALFNGTIDEVKVYNRTLSSDEVLQHYQKGLEKFAVDGYLKTIKASIRNIGTTPLSNFTILSDINGRLYLNSTPQNGGLTLPAASEPLTLQANTYYDGPVKSLKVSVSNCPISMTLTNDSSAAGTC